MIKVKRIITTLCETTMARLEALDAPPAIHADAASEPAYMTPQFLAYIRNMENPQKVGYKKGLWYPHNDPSGGKNVGYGHQLKTATELAKANKGLTNDEVERLLKDDIRKASAGVHKYIQKKYGLKLKLHVKQEQMLIDYVFNLGSLDSFPKMTDAVLRWEPDKMGKQYKRFAKIGGKRKELTKRNTAFKSTFMDESSV